jgi:hypothetical protein
VRVIATVYASVALLVALVSFPLWAIAANDTSISPWVLDTASGTAIQTGNIKVLCVRWVGATTAGHQAILTDNAGRVVWEEVAAGSNFSTSECMPLLFIGGIKLTTLGSGKVYLYVP